MNQQVSGANGGEARAVAAAANSGAGAAPQHDALHDVAALLTEQLSACHAAAARCFAIANDEEDFDMAVRLDALKLATRLVQASAAAASAVKRVKGGEFHHHVTVARIDYPAEKAARKAREQAAKAGKGDNARKRVREKIERLIKEEQAEERHTSISRDGPDANSEAA